MNDRDQAVAVSTDVEDHIFLHRIGIFEDLPDFDKAPPPGGADDLLPRRDFSSGARILLHGPAQVLLSNDVHEPSLCGHRNQGMFKETFQTAKCQLKLYILKSA